MSFVGKLFQLIGEPQRFITENLNRDKFVFLNFSIGFLFLISFFEFNAFLTITTLGSLLDVFTYFLMYVVYSLIVLTVVFLESSIVNTFVESKHVGEFGIHHIFGLYCVSLLPLLALPFVTVILCVFSAGLSLFLTVLLIWLCATLVSFWLRYKYFYMYRKYIKYSIFYTLAIPILLWCLVILTMILSGFVTTKIIAQLLNEVLNEFKMMITQLN